MSNLLKDSKELMKYWDYEKNKDLDLDKLTLGSSKIAWWKCDKGHSYDAKIKRKNYEKIICPICSNHRVLKGYNDLATTNPELLKEWDFTKNTISPYEITAGAEKMIWWICPKEHSYQSYAFNRKRGVGCPICDGKKVLIGYNDLATTNPKIAKEWDYEKNGDLKPTDITEGSTTNVWWICENGHSYDSRAKDRKHGLNCPYCSNKKVLVGFNDLYTYCIDNHLEEIIEEFDNDKNEFSMKDVTAGSDKETWWKCPKGHSYQSSPSRRVMRGSGCGICSHNILVKGVNDLLTTHPEIAKEWDYKKNKVGPDEVMAGSNIDKYWFLCPKGHSYHTTVLGRKRGTNCPQCNIEKHTSIPERSIYYYMKKYFNDVVDSYHNKKIGRKEIDIFLPTFNFGIEYDGRAWHKKYTRDIEKDNICLKNDITLFRVREIGCFEYESSSIKKYINPYDTKELNEAIKTIFDYINKKYKQKINADIDVERDRVKILELMNLSEKENSIAKYCPSIKKYWDSSKNGLITPEQISHGSMKRVFLKCPKGHKWDKIVSNIKKEIKCPFCYGRKVLFGFNDLATTHPEIAKEWNYEKNGNLKPTDIKAGSNKNVWWKCDKGHEWQAVITIRANGYKKCSVCNSKK
jgi:hypothetical protein